MASEISAEHLKRIIVGGEAVLLVDQAKEFGATMKTNGLTKSQIRGVFGTVRQIQAGWERNEHQQNMRQVLLLKPRLAYQGAREQKVQPLAEVLTGAIDLIAETKGIPNDQITTVQQTRFANFVDLFEAILAYHTAAGGK
jgi:CRISPR-associated protein Csm2